MDVVVVGAGIVGLAHAALAAERGLSVTVIDRDHRAVGASIRNFGHCCITAQTGELYQLAQSARRHWLDFSARANFWASEAGALMVAGTDMEMAVLGELSARREAGQIVLLSAGETRERLDRGAESGVQTNADGGTRKAGTAVVGGAWLRDDLRVDPRTTVGKLAGWLGSQAQVSVHWNTAALDFAPGSTRRAAVRTSRGTVEADRVFVCVGHDVDYLFPELAERHRIRRCSLQMVAARPPVGLKLGPAILTATSMLRYDAFTDMPSAAALRAQVETRDSELLGIDANAMFTQRPDGTLLLGDSHAYQKTVEPFLAEPTTNLFLERLADVLGVEGFDVTERWQGVYASSDVGPLLVADVADSVTVVSVTAGVGMTISFGLAERNVSALP